MLDDMGNDKHVAALENKTNLLKFLHLNTQSLVSIFNEFYVTLAKYPFDVVALSETWLRQNKMLLDYVHIPGYELLYNNRDNMRGGGVDFI